MKISWSAMSEYEACSLQAYLRKIVKVGPPADKRRFIAGTVGHAFLERWANSGFGSIDPNEALMLFDKAEKKESIHWLNPDDRNVVRLRIIEDAKLIIQAGNHVGFSKFGTKIKPEKWINRPMVVKPGFDYLKGHFIVAKLDLIVLGEDWIIDMKMSTNKKYWDKDQLLFYTIVFFAQYGRLPKRVSFFIPQANDPDKYIVDVPLDEEAISNVYDRIYFYVDGWMNKVYKATGDINMDCFWCECKPWCPRYSVQINTSISETGIRRAKFDVLGGLGNG